MIGQARADVAAALTGLAVPVHAYPTQAVSPPAAIVMPGSPYLDGQMMSGAAHQVGLELHIVTALWSARTLDELLWSALALLAGVGARVQAIQAPQSDLETGTLTARIPFTLKWKA